MLPISSLMYGSVDWQRAQGLCPQGISLRLRKLRIIVLASANLLRTSGNGKIRGRN